MSRAPQVAALYRYPVKSMTGEQVEQLELDARGGQGDRLWSVRAANGKIGSGKSSQRFAAVPGLLELRAAIRDQRVCVTFDDGTRCFVDAPGAADRLTKALGVPLTFVRETGVTHFDDGPVSLIGAASLAAVAAERGEPVAAARFRPNIVLAGLEPFAEDGWVDHELELGEARLRITLQSSRCVMVDMKTADLPAQPGNLEATGKLNRGCLGVIANVVRPGRVRVGDCVELC